MRDIQGHVVVYETVHLPPEWGIVGPPTPDCSSCPDCYDIMGNGLQVFPTRKKAQRAIDHLLDEKGIYRVWPATLTMRIADTRKEMLRQLPEKSSLVAIVYDERYPRNMIYGPAPEMKSDFYPLLCSTVTRNGFGTWSSREDARRMARKIFAIERRPVYLAEFWLDFKKEDAIVRPGARRIE